MLRWLWDLLFTRSQWRIIAKHDIYDPKNRDMACGTRYVLQDQWGNIREKVVGCD